MGEKKEVGEKKVQPPKKGHLKYFSMKGDLHLNEKLKGFLLPGEVVVYQAADLFFTNKRLIKHRVSKAAKFFHFFYSTFEDLDLRFIESIKAKNVINFKMLFLGLLVIALGPLASFLSAIPGIGGIGDFIGNTLVVPLGINGLFLIGVILIVAAVILRDRVIEFWGHGVVIRTRHFHDDELVKVRELQHLRLTRLGLDK